MSDELYHYGVKGMRWGVRRYQNPDGTLTADGKEHYSDKSNNKFHLSDKQKKALKIGLIAAGTGLAIFGGIALYKYMFDSNYGYTTYKMDPLRDCLDEFPDSKKIFSKGTTFQRISPRAIEDYVEQGQIYVSTLFSDNQKYISRMPSEISRRGHNDVYVHRIKIKDQIATPSRREAASIYLEQHPNATQAAYLKFISNMASIRSIQSMSMTSDPFKFQERKNAIKYLDDYTRFIDELKRRGYSAIIDENDIGWTKMPLIFFNVDNSTMSVGTHHLTLAERVIAEAMK